MSSIELLNELFRKAFHTTVKKATCLKINEISSILDISLFIESQNKKKKTKGVLTNEIKDQIEGKECAELCEIAKRVKLPIEIEVKEILKHNIEVKTVIDSGICLPLDIFLHENQCLRELFTTECDLYNVNNVVKSNNCVPHVIQGLYILAIGKENNYSIVKLGSFAETQGLYKRIMSFGGGNYETGSLTNKWFQQFIKKVLAEGFTAKFVYFNNTRQEKICIKDLNGNDIEMMPYIMRPLETQLFEKYRDTNNNIPPIFGSNCL